MFRPNMSCDAGHTHQASDPEKWRGLQCLAPVDDKGGKCQLPLRVDPDARYEE